jgi:hypothetical protein
MNSYAEAKRVPTEKGNTRIVSVNSKLRMLWPIYYFQVRNEADEVCTKLTVRDIICN